MKKIVWIVNKYVEGVNKEQFYPYFLKNVQDQLTKRDSMVSFVFFSNRFRNTVRSDDNYFFDDREYQSLTDHQIDEEAQRIERDYCFTFKQAYYPDILQVSKFQNTRKM